MNTIENIKLRFDHLKNKNILIYGTGINAKLLIEALQDFNIVGILDRIRYEGYIQEVPIITWDEVTKDTAEVIIIASKMKNFREIFLRIRHYGEIFDMDIYNFSGQNLSSKFYYADYTYEEMECLKYSKQDLFDMIDKYDAISFDLFDTLIMRKVFEPDDIFDIVERKIKKYGINICNFKKKRRTAELNSEGADIFAIYKELKKIVDVSDDELSLIMKEELACEKANIIARDSMVEVFNYAIEKGKIVSIISNMYLSYDMIQDILNNVGIKGYGNLFISCEYGKGKSEGLFEVYKEKIGNDKKCLHIGDDYVEDILSAEKNGIVAFYVNSSLELLKRSRIRQLLLNTHGFENQLMIGLVISKLFNNPFILYNTSGHVPISSVKIFAEVFIAPIVYVYMKKLLEYIHNNQFDGVIFPARDGYLFFNLYERYRKKDTSLPKGSYLAASRKVAIAVSQYSEDDVAATTEKYTQTKNNLNFWKKVMYFNANNIEEIIKESEVKRNLYVRYMQNMGINLEKNYLFCELVSNGTTHYAFNRIFNKEIDGFYLSGFKMWSKLKNRIASIYPFELNNITSRTDILETVLSSPKPSVREIDSNGGIIYELEERTKNEIDIMINMHNYIIDFIEEYDKICENIDEINLNLLDNLMGIFDGIDFKGEMKSFTNRISFDTMSLQKISIMEKR